MQMMTTIVREHYKSPQDAEILIRDYLPLDVYTLNTMKVSLEEHILMQFVIRLKELNAVSVNMKSDTFDKFKKVILSHDQVVELPKTERSNHADTSVKCIREDD